MADYDRRPRGGGGYNNRKRRYRDEDDYDRRPPRRRFEEPLVARVRRQLLAIAETPHKRVEDEVQNIAKTVAEHYDDEELRNSFYDLTLQLVIEQPFKVPFVAAVVITVNTLKQEMVQEILARTTAATEIAMAQGNWRDVKLYLKFLGCLQGLLGEDGVFSVLEELFSRACDLQTASSDDMIGMELVRIVLLTIPYIMVSSSTDSAQKAADLIDKTEIISLQPHVLESVVDPYPGNGKDEATEPTSVVALLQKQLQAEAASGWKLACLPKPWKMVVEDGQPDPLTTATKHALPLITVPESLSQGPRTLFPDIFFSVYAEQDIETVPATSNVASCLIRDAIVDTINILDYNRNAVASFLINIDSFFAPDTFVKRATPFDRLRDIQGDRSTWKPEDVVVDAVFSQLFQLPNPEHKHVYYHSVLTEACRIAPAAIAPSLGRAIRYLYRNGDSMDLELTYRFMDWFAHHLSNFGFTWKWTEWVDDVELPNLHPKKAFIQGALDKEVRLSFPQRIRGTLPPPYQPLITEAKENETPDFKYNDDRTHYCEQGREILALMRKKATEEEIQVQLDAIQAAATEHGIADPLVPSTDAYMTTICFIGSKSLSHVLSCIERCKDRLIAVGTSSEAARRQIIDSIMEYWKDQPGIGVNIIDKLLNYTILTPLSVIEWALVEHSKRGAVLAQAHMYEMVASTVFKVTSRVRGVVNDKSVEGLDDEQKAALDETLARERQAERELFKVLEEVLVAYANGQKDEVMETGNGDTEAEALVRQWGTRWLRVFRRKVAVEEAHLQETVNGTATA